MLVLEMTILGVCAGIGIFGVGVRWSDAVRCALVKEVELGGRQRPSLRRFRDPKRKGLHAFLEERY